MSRMRRNIVYPDADAESVQFLGDYRLSRLEKPGEVIIYPDAPADDQTFIERLAGAGMR